MLIDANDCKHYYAGCKKINESYIQYAVEFENKKSEILQCSSFSLMCVSESEQTTAKL